jgi:hypothetical protein
VRCTGFGVCVSTVTRGICTSGDCGSEGSDCGCSDWDGGAGCAGG